MAARERLKVQEPLTERREDELKASILNARMGLKRAGSQGSGTKDFPVGLKTRGSTPVAERETTPVEMTPVAKGRDAMVTVEMRDAKPVTETVVKVEDFNKPAKETTPLAEVESEEEDVKVGMELTVDCAVF
jgi:hypothetical protein